MMAQRVKNRAPVYAMGRVNESAGEVQNLRRLNLRAGGGPNTYDEAWLQRLLHEHPEVLPIDQIESGFGRIIPLCRELPLSFAGGRSGALDNLFVTDTGNLLLVEAKLWRNPEARRTVVAQAMEYAGAVFRLKYEELQSAVLRARTGEIEPPGSLHDIVTKSGAIIDEIEFVDAVSMNLKRGRALVAVVGDGIREDLSSLVGLLQSHAGHRFTFVLIQMGIYDTPQIGLRLVIPSILAKTELIERGVIQIDSGIDRLAQIVVREPAGKSGKTTYDRSFGIGEDQFYELLEQREPGVSAILKSFIANTDALNIRVERQGGLNLKHTSPKGNDLNLGTIDKYGFLDTSPATWWGRTGIGRRYNEKLAAQIGGFVRNMKNGQESAVRTASGKTPRISDLLPAHEEAWLKAMDQYIRDSFEAANEGEG
jgi:hypothetical protein